MSNKQFRVSLPPGEYEELRRTAELFVSDPTPQEVVLTLSRAYHNAFERLLPMLREGLLENISTGVYPNVNDES